MLVLFSLRSSAQKDSAQKELRWSVGVVASPDFDYIFNTQDNFSHTSIYTNKPKFGYTGGINMNYMFSQFAGLEFGLQYVNMGLITQWTFSNGPNTIISIPPNNIVKEVDKSNVNLLYVPIKINFFAGKGRIRYIGSVGAAFGLNYSEADITTTTYLNGQTSRNREVYPSTPLDECIFAQVSSGIVYLAGNRFTFRAEPTFRLQVFDSMGGGFGQSYLWSAGIVFGAYYHF